MDQYLDQAILGNLETVTIVHVFGKLGFLQGRKATCYPSMEDTLEGAQFVEDSAVCDGNVITSRGVGTAIEFSMLIIEKLLNKKTADDLKDSIVYKR